MTNIQNQSSGCGLVAAHSLSMKTFSDIVWSSLVLPSNSKLYVIWSIHCNKHTCTRHFSSSFTVCNINEILCRMKYAQYQTLTLLWPESNIVSIMNILGILLQHSFIMHQQWKTVWNELQLTTHSNFMAVRKNLAYNYACCRPFSTSLCTE